MSDNKITPLPWKAVGKEDVMIKGHVCSVGATQDGTEYFVQGVDYPEGIDTALTDAAYIVQAANAYPLAEKMASALEGLIHELGLIYREPEGGFEDAEQLAKEVLAAWRNSND